MTSFDRNLDQKRDWHGTILLRRHDVDEHSQSQKEKEAESWDDWRTWRIYSGIRHEEKIHEKTSTKYAESYERRTNRNGFKFRGLVFDQNLWTKFLLSCELIKY